MYDGEIVSSTHSCKGVLSLLSFEFTDNPSFANCAAISSTNALLPDAAAKWRIDALLDVVAKISALSRMSSFSTC